MPMPVPGQRDRRTVRYMRGAMGGCGALSSPPCVRVVSDGTELISGHVISFLSFSQFGQNGARPRPFPNGQTKIIADDFEFFCDICLIGRQPTAPVGS